MREDKPVWYIGTNPRKGKGETMNEKHERLLTPIGEARWAHVQEPKQPFEGKGEAKYQIDVVFDPADTEWKQWGREITARVKASPGKHNPIKWDVKVDGKGAKVKTGKLMATFKTGARFKPPLFDKFGRPLADGTLIGNGSRVRINYTPAPYEGFGGGITLYLNAVQVVDLVAYAKSAKDFGFDVTEAPPGEEQFFPDEEPAAPAADPAVAVEGEEHAGDPESGLPF
jgi:hypothetical protein